MLNEKFIFELEKTLDMQEVLDEIIDAARSNRDPYSFGMEVAKILYEHQYIPEEIRDIVGG